MQRKKTHQSDSAIDLDKMMQELRAENIKMYPSVINNTRGLLRCANTDYLSGSRSAKEYISEIFNILKEARGYCESYLNRIFNRNDFDEFIDPILKTIAEGKQYSIFDDYLPDDIANKKDYLSQILSELRDLYKNRETLSEKELEQFKEKFLSSI